MSSRGRQAFIAAVRNHTERRVADAEQLLLGVVTDDVPLTVALIETGVTLHDDELLLAQAVRQSPPAAGDQVLVVRKRISGEIYWLVTSVISDSAVVLDLATQAELDNEIALRFLADDALDARIDALEASKPYMQAIRSSDAILTATWSIIALNSVTDAGLVSGLSLVTTAGQEHILCSQAGMYLVTGEVIFGAGTVGDRLAMLSATTGTPTAATNSIRQQRTGAHANAALLSMARVVRFAANTKVSIQCWHSQGATMNVTGSLEVTRLGP